MLLVFAGGAIGSSVRYLTGLALNPLADLFLVNLLGALLLGVFYSHPWFSSSEKKAFWGTGFAGGFTTMSGVGFWLVYGSFLSFGGILVTLAMFLAGLGCFLLGKRIGVRN